MRKILIGIGTLLLALAVFAVFSRQLLVINEKPVKSDVIMILSGDGGRLEKGMELYKEGYAKYVMLSTPLGLEVSSKQQLQKDISPENLLFEQKATSTYTNAVYTKQLAEKYGFKSAIVVTSDYHMRRSKLAYDRVYKNSGIRLTYVSALYNSPVPWYKNPREVSHTVSEYIRLTGYMLGLYDFIDLPDGMEPGQTAQ
ncbi:YdcF family protein [Metabacillus sp. GX 13764]|uniref:YdcF family protein n=1 Tax=Metabacillus kandeliae TaxID=2900151 RepID=UPI001E37055E|nr:YdcF family protein [Metabacillus kandeliae]MCD7034614.1 YdcF family protein [Metabacillus kandeliae]